MIGNVHRCTPAVAATDPRGQVIRTVEYLRNVAGGEVQTLITRQQHDVAGRLVAQRDPRLSTPNTTSVYGLDGQPLKTHSVDAGVSINLQGLAGKPVQSWDARSNHWRTSYDSRLRVLAVEENKVTVETFTYFPASADPGHNQRGQMSELKDPSGGVELQSYALTGQPLGETRTFEDGKAFTSHQRFSPLGAVLEHTDAGGHRQQSIYDIAGQLRQVQLQLNGETAWKPVLNDAQYNAAGQIIGQLAGNGVTSRWHYHAADGRLLQQSAQRATGPEIQDFEYNHDRMGNVVGILDHTYTPTFFRNQRVDGQRTFSYDSLSRLISASGHDDAPPADNPGRPQPTDPYNRLNYIQTYVYDNGNNLTRLTHVRDGNTYTREMFIDPGSNRGVRREPGNPDPDFNALFDRAGNLQALQTGQPIQWNSRSQLESMILAEHATGPHDLERYCYSQGARVYKRHETHTTKASHFHDVRYLPSLEIRTKSNGEELHVINLAIGVGNVTCLHWVAGKPAGIDADQLRYTHEDHLGSSLMELDQLSRMISKESYYPYGGTASLAARSQIEVDYKFIRYSGKEMDVTGLYYYGARYYAPWLQRWVSSDPAGDVDGLNRYAFVGNNPLVYVDNGGLNRTPAELKRTITWNLQKLSAIETNMQTLQNQLFDLQQPGRWRKTLAKNVVYQVGSAAAGWFTSFNAASSMSEALPGISADLIGLTAGNRVADASVGQYDKLVGSLALNTPIVPRTSTINREATVAGLTPAPILPSRDKYDMNTREGVQQFSGDAISKVVGAYVPGVGETMALGSTAQEANQAEEGLSSMKMGKIQNVLDDLQLYVVEVKASVNADFSELGVEEFYDEKNGMRNYLFDLALNRVGTAQAGTIRRSDVAVRAKKAGDSVATANEFLKMYHEKLPAIRHRASAK